MKLKFSYTFAIILTAIFAVSSCRVVEKCTWTLKSVKLFPMSYKPSATLAGVKKSDYQAVDDLAQRIVASMTGNVTYPTPNPALAAISTQEALVATAIATWGPVGNRGSHADLLALRDAVDVLYAMLLAEASYVTSVATVTAGLDYTVMAALIATSGFAVHNVPAPQGALAAPQGLHQMFSAFVDIHTPKLKWSKPIGLTSPNNVKSYQVIRSLTNDVTAGTVIATVTKTSYIDLTAAASTVYYYFIRGVNTNGPGAESNVCQVNTPAA